MAPKDLDKLIHKYLEGKCTEAERDLINSWYAALGKTPDQPPVGKLREKISAAEKKILANLQAHSFAVPVVPLIAERQVSFPWRYINIAASVLICLAAGYYFITTDTSVAPVAIVKIESGLTTIENSTQGGKRVILPDGSIVKMSADSRIQFSEDANAPSRELFLEGEAYFDVAHNSERPFYVYAGNVVTKVLGTSFIVRARGADEKVTVSVKTGKVTVYTKSATHKKTVLVPNQEAVYDRVRDVVATQPVPVDQLLDEKQNFMEMHFEETPVPQVLGMLVKAYDIDIVFDEEVLSGCVLTSSFYEEGLYDRIDVICTAIGATYKIVEATIVIESQGCHLKPE